MEECYNCGKPVSKEDGTRTREHIPAQGLFAGYGDEYKKNRIVVPACTTCNGGSSGIDEEFRNVIGTISNDTALDTISANTAKAIVTRNKQYDRLRLDKKGSVAAVEFDKRKILDYHVKVFKGLFYHQYGKAISKEYTIVAFIDQDNATQEMINYLKANFNWKYSGHPDVFDYILQPFRENLVNKDMKDLTPAPDELVYMGIMRYNKSHGALVVATRMPIPTRR